MSDRRSRAAELGLELMEPESARLPNADARTRELGDMLAELGYHRLKEAAEESVKLKKLKPDNLLEALRMANITPFTWRSVNRYKFDVLNKLNTPPDTTKMDKAQRDSVIAFCVGGVFLLGTGFLFTDHASWMYWLPTGVVGLGLFGLGSVLGERYWDLYREHVGAFLNMGRHLWMTAQLKDYPHEIPIEVAERIAAVREVYPKAKFEVEYLTENPDPFLVVRHGEERYAIAVWDEPTFEGELLA